MSDMSDKEDGKLKTANEEELRNGSSSRRKSRPRSSKEGERKKDFGRHTHRDRDKYRERSSKRSSNRDDTRGSVRASTGLRPSVSQAGSKTRAEDDREAKRGARKSRKELLPGAFQSDSLDTGKRSGDISRKAKEERESKRKVRRSRIPIPGAASVNGRPSHSVERKKERTSKASIPGAERSRDSDAKIRTRRSTHSPKPGAESVGRNDVARSRREERKSRRSDSPDDNDEFPLDEIIKQRVRAIRGERDKRDSKGKARLRGPSAIVAGVESRISMKKKKLGDEDSIDLSGGTAHDSATENLPEALHVGAETVQENDDDRITMETQRQEGVQQVVLGRNGEAANLEPEQTNSREKPRWMCSSRNMAIAALFILAIAAGVVGFVLSQSPENEVVANLGTSSPTASNIEEEPDVPSEFPSMFPSESPTEEIVFAPPSEEDCLAIQNKEPVNGQYSESSFDLPLSVGLSDGKDIDIALQELVQRIEQHLVPELAGCAQPSRRRLEQNQSIRSIRGSRRLKNFRYAIANANVSGKQSNGENCSPGSPQPCYQVVVTLQLFVKGEMRFLTLVSIVSDVFEQSSEHPLVSKLGLSEDGFVHIELLGVENLTPTESPSNMPSSLPSLFPSTLPSSSPSTSFPTETLSQNPTLGPAMDPTTGLITPAPTSSQTPAPTNLQTPAPSLAPVVGLTRPPTPNPSQSPTALPSVEPSQGPTSRPSSRPTFAPVVGPTPPPTATLSKAPSVNPTAGPTSFPTSNPTNGPTGSPTSGPSNTPTSGPTSGPTRDPTSGPTYAPTRHDRQIVGSSCTVNDMCASGICSSNICKSDLAGPCTQDDHCLSQLGVCANGVCKVGLNGACNIVSDCVLGSCLTNGACGFPNPVGFPCGAAVDCISEICLDGICKSPIGGSCDGFEHFCAEGSCFGTTCEAPNGPGGFCTVASNCEGDYQCLNFQCGYDYFQSCTANNQCVQPLATCHQGFGSVCHQKGLYLSQCLVGSDCLSNQCGTSVFFGWDPTKCA